MTTTPELLDWLVAHGLTNAEFWRVHHYRLRGRRDTIKAHRDWTATHPSRSQTNHAVRERLQFMRDVIESLGVETLNHEQWITLTEAAWISKQ